MLFLEQILLLHRTHQLVFHCAERVSLKQINELLNHAPPNQAVLYRIICLDLKLVFLVSIQQVNDWKHLQNTLSQ